jgi:hypothetical protein
MSEKIVPVKIGNDVLILATAANFLSIFDGAN